MSIEEPLMSKPKLRIFSDKTENQHREQELDRISGAADAKTVAVPLGKIVPLLLDAAKHDRAWLNDFAEDLVKIDADLYEVLLAYQSMQRRAA